jgi:hypothetical protein
MRSIAHIINLFTVKPTSDLFIAQPITLESMKVAQAFAHGQVEVTLFSAQYPEDRSIVPNGFQLTGDLDRSVLEVGTFRLKRKLPFLVDALDRLYEASGAEYFIYTNNDIALMPHFYVTVNQFIEEGYDAFVINRRTISAKYQSPAQLPLMYAEVGEPHEGHDCFVFRREVYPQYKLGAICIGATWIGRALLWNLICHAKNFKEFTEEHLTFHVGPGNDRMLGAEEYADYRAHNKREAAKIMVELERQCGPFGKNGPFSRYPLEVHLTVDSKYIVKLLLWEWVGSIKHARQLWRSR